MFTERQINQLKAVARPKYINGVNNPLYGQENKLLDEVISQIKEENPNSFLTERDLKNRVFYHKPRASRYPILYANYLQENI